MSKYTTEVRFICETNSGLGESVGFDDVDDVIKNSRTKIFNFDYPIFDEAYRETLESKILLHYYTREIGQETVGLWKLKLRSKLCDIMPYYNQLYESAKLEFNPFYDIDYKKEHEGEFEEAHNDTDRDTGTVVNAGETSSNEKNRYSDTPQGGLQGIESNTYLTNARIIDNTGEATNTQTNDLTAINQGAKDGTDKYTDKVTGKMGTKSYSKMLQEYRDTFLNIDLMVIDELKPLFMQLW